MEVMERHLAEWIKDLYQEHIPVHLTIIQEKVISLHEAVKELEQEDAAKVKPFGASVHQEAGFTTFRSSMASKM
jgi:hypothetical protein